MAKVKLTKRIIDSLNSDNPRGEKYFDTETRGFGIKVYASGKKSFILRYGKGKVRREITLGAYGPLTLEDARNEAHIKIGEFKKGIDPLKDRKEETISLTFGEWVDQYIAFIKPRKKHVREDIRYLGQAVKKWKNRILSEIMEDDIEQMYNKIVESGKPVTANRWLASIRACLQRAYRKKKLTSNPAMLIEKVRDSEPRTRVLSDEEYSRLQQAIENIPDSYTKAAFILLTETGARFSEVLHTQWKDIDFENKLWTIPSTKSGYLQRIPLHPEVLDMLRSLPQTSKYVIAGKIIDKPRADLKRPWINLITEAKLNNVHIHDIRRTFCVQVARDQGLLVASKLLRHSDTRVTERHYAPLDVKTLEEALAIRKRNLSK